ncbi:MAG TPA: hypothetical protein VLJ78_05360 [Microvirga sp.]|nr:hypothetical protein [Microvirga sp.]
MITASLQRGFAAGILSVAFIIGTGPAALAQAQRSAQPARPAAQKAAPAAKPAPAAAATRNSRSRASSAAGAGAAAGAAATGAAAATPATGPGGASLLASYNDWNVYTAQAGRSKICYALSQPKDRQPRNLSRDPAYLFVSFRPAENVRNEVALVLGFTTKEDGPAEAAIGRSSYALLTKATNAWLKNPAEEGQAIATMARGQSVVVKTQSVRGNQLTDRYSLSGFNQALERARRECS